VDGRTEAGFRHRFRALLAALPEALREQEVARLIDEARQTARRGELSLAHALLREHEALRASTVRNVSAHPTPPATGAPRFLCDPSLAGLSRWLHAAGYDAVLSPAVALHRLPDEALRQGRVLLTTDAEALERRIVAFGSLRVVWLPSALTMREKLALVLHDLALPLRPPRCMACGGELETRGKDEVLARIPPRTARWKDEYFVCGACDRLYWKGTHWERIETALTSAAGA
jgi:uncharacterized protein